MDILQFFIPQHICILLKSMVLFIIAESAWVKLKRKRDKRNNVLRMNKNKRKMIAARLTF